MSIRIKSKSKSKIKIKIKCELTRRSWPEAANGYKKGIDTMRTTRHCLAHNACRLLALCCWCVPAAAAPADALEVHVTQNTDRLVPYQVFELTFRHGGEYTSPTWDVTIDVTFTSPTGKKTEVGGFFYGSSKSEQVTVAPSAGARGRPLAVWSCNPADLWKARYAPSETGQWSYVYVFRNDAGAQAAGDGTFAVVKGRVRSRGWVRINRRNPYRFVFEDGSPYFPIGYQHGIGDGNHNGSVLDDFAMEGPFRPDPAGARPKPPAGAMFLRGPSMGSQNADVKFGRFARAGFNMWRFSPNNAGLKVLYADPTNRVSGLDCVNYKEAQMVDELLRTTRKYGLRNFYGIFGYTKVFNNQPGNRDGMDKVRRIIKYSVDRWGAYVDFWEFLNEQHADTRWYETVIPYLESIDPYDHPIATSWERPELPGIEVNAPHWYGNEPELLSDQVTADRARRMKRFGKPVVYGEQGNYRGREDRSAEGVGGVWDPGSARRMRVRCWTALFREICFVFWETSYAKDGHVRNIWIGPQERQYIRVLQDFAGLLDRDVRVVEVPLSGAAAGDVRAYGLRSDRCTGAYFHHHACQQCRKANHTEDRTPHTWSHDRGQVRGLKVGIDVPIASTGYWYRPTDGAIVGSFEAEPGHRTVIAPPFSIDLALIVTNGDLPDTDGDGIPNHRDADDDNDGVPDAQDAWPLEREEWADVDADRIGDNLDADVDADGKPDDRDHNGAADCEERDWDGDGVPNAGVIPWDAFPRDPNEWRDTDGDGIGDNADTDDDGDGYSDADEKKSGTDPRNALSFP